MLSISIRVQKEDGVYLHPDSEFWMHLIVNGNSTERFERFGQF